MKHYQTISYSIIALIVLLFGADILFMNSLYNSIKERYISDVEQCLMRADMIELVTRLNKQGYGHDGIIDVWLGLQPNDVGAASTPEELMSIKYSQGFKRMDRQLISVITKYLHDTYGEDAGTPDRQLLEEVFRRELSFSGFFPEEVVVLIGDDCLEYDSSLWEIGDRVDGKLICRAVISPLSGNVLREMSGVIASNALIALVLGFAFWYLLRVIQHQRTIEEMKDDFTNNMTHELKTPIAIAYAANDALLQFPDPSDEARTKKYLSAALEQLSKLTGLVENILAMSMERRRHLAMAKEKISLRPFLEKIIEQQKIKATKPTVFKLSCNEDVELDADPAHLTNVLNNLIDNSMKYSGESVEITIFADKKSLSVADNGIGIPEKALPVLFNKFYRVPQGNRQAVRGYGIGLFYVKSIIEKHGWIIGVESRLGKGSKFNIYFAEP